MVTKLAARINNTNSDVRLFNLTFIFSLKLSYNRHFVVNIIYNFFDLISYMGFKYIFCQWVSETTLSCFINFSILIVNQDYLRYESNS